MQVDENSVKSSLGKALRRFFCLQGALRGFSDCGFNHPALASNCLGESSMTFMDFHLPD